MIWLLFLGCSQGPWTEAAVMERTLTRLDRDHDGRVSGQEYDAVVTIGKHFGEVDVDRNGQMSADELARLIRDQDPLHFDPTPHDGPGRRLGAAAPIDVSPEAAELAQRRAVVVAVIQTLCAELRAVDPAMVLPDEATISEAAAAGTLDTPPARALLVRIQADYQRVGLTFPAALLAD